MMFSALLALPFLMMSPQDEAPKPLAPASRPAMPEWRKTLMAADKAYGEKKYKEAAEGYEKAVGMVELPAPNKSRVYYGLGRAFAMAGEKDKAVTAIVNAIDGGFFDFDGLADDTDLTTVARDAKIADAMKRNQAKKDANDAEVKKQMESARKSMDERAKEQKDELLEKLKDEKGAGFEFKFDLKGVDGKPISSKIHEGKVAVIDIWGTWCPPCRMEIPNFVELVKKHKNDAFVMIGLNDESTREHKNGDAEAAKVKKFAAKNGIEYPLALIDEATIKQVPGFQGYPTTLFVDKKGKVRLVEVGYSSLDNIDAIVSALLAEK